MPKKTRCRIPRSKGKAGKTGARVASAMKAELLGALLELRQKVRLQAYQNSLTCVGVSCGADDNWIKAEQQVKAASKRDVLPKRTALRATA
jgi:hypothetical protein